MAKGSSLIRSSRRATRGFLLPEVQKNEVLVKVREARPFFTLPAGIRKDEVRGSKKMGSGGFDFSGEVIRRGAEVSDFREGERVFGLTSGSFSELVVVPHHRLARMPDSLDFRAAVMLPSAGLTAYQILMELVRPRRGDVLLVHGAAEEAGMFLVQLAKFLGAAVIGHALPKDSRYLREIGADQVIEEGKQKYQNLLRNVDVMIDLVAYPARRRSFQVLKKGGLLVSLHRKRNGKSIRQLKLRSVAFLLRPDGEGLRAIARLVEAGVIKIGME